MYTCCNIRHCQLSEYILYCNMKRQMCAKKLHEITRHIFNDRLIKLLLFVTE